MTDDDDNTLVEMDRANFSWKDEEGFTNVSLNSEEKNEEDDKDFEIVAPFTLKDVSVFIEKVIFVRFVYLYSSATLIYFIFH